MADSAEAVVCGAGIAGASIAYYLALHGIKVTVIERERVAYGASGTAAGLLIPAAPADWPTPLGKLINRGLAVHRELAETLDGRRRYDYAEVESYAVARTEAEAVEIERLWGKGELKRGSAARTAWLDGDIVGSVAVPGAAQLDPEKLTAVLLEEACARGARVLTADVQGVRRQRGKVTGVIASAETIATEVVIVAMGPWSVEAEAWLKTFIPVTPLKGQILRYRFADASEGGFSTLDGNYAVRKPTGVVYTGTTEEEAGFDTSATAEARASIEAWGSSVSRRFAGQEPFEQTACLRPLSADGLPIVGAVTGLAGAYLATGHGRKGIALAPATSQALAELIATGKATSMDLRPFSPGRFREG